VIPGNEATEALREAATSLKGQFLVGVVNSLGVLRDAKSVPLLVKLAGDPASGAAREASLALGRIATPAAIQTVRELLQKGSAEIRPSAAEACLLAAERLRSTSPGDTPSRRTAVDLCEEVRAASVPEPLRVAALRGLILLEPETRLAALPSGSDTSLAVWEAVVSAARELPRTSVTRALADRLSSASPSAQVLLLTALNERADPAALAAVEKLLASASSPEVKIASLETLGALGNAATAGILLKTLNNPNATSAEIDAASSSLTRLKGADDINLALVNALENAASDRRARLIQVLGHRRAATATPALLREAASADQAVSRAALEALAAVATPKDLPALIRLASTRTDSAIRDRAEQTVYTVCLKEPDTAKRSAPLLDAFRGAAQPAQKTSIMEMLAMLGDRPAYRAIASATEDREPAVIDTSVRLLANWPDAAAAPKLLEIFKGASNDSHRNLALRGLVTQATLWKERGEKSPPAEAVEWLSQANAAIRDNPDEKRVILSGLGDLNNAAGLRLLAPYLEDPSVRREAALATLRAIRGLQGAEEKSAARGLIDKILASAGDDEVRRQAEEVLKTLGGS
jgi:HEAT repeat protein